MGVRKACGSLLENELDEVSRGCILGHAGRSPGLVYLQPLRDGGKRDVTKGEWGQREEGLGVEGAQRWDSELQAGGRCLT